MGFYTFKLKINVLFLFIVFICVICGLPYEFSRFALRGSLALEAVRGGAQRVGDIFVADEHLRSCAVTVGNKCRLTSSGVFGFDMSVRTMTIVLAIFAVGRNHAQGFFAEAGHAGKSFHFAFAQLR